VTVTEIEEWEVKDNIILFWLLHSIEPNISEQFVYRTVIAQEIWDSLKRRYSKITLPTSFKSSKKSLKTNENKNPLLSCTQKYKSECSSYLQLETSDPEQIR
jgi:hypothetical protein